MTDYLVNNDNPPQRREARKRYPWSTIVAARERFNRGEPIKTIAKDLGMSPGYCKSVCYGESRQTEDSGRKHQAPIKANVGPPEMIRGADGQTWRKRVRGRKQFVGIIPFADIQNLRVLYAAQKVPIRQLAQRFGLSVSYCHRLIKGKSKMLA